MQTWIFTAGCRLMKLTANRLVYLAIAALLAATAADIIEARDGSDE